MSRLDLLLDILHRTDEFVDPVGIYEALKVALSAELDRIGDDATRTAMEQYFLVSVATKKSIDPALREKAQEQLMTELKGK